MHTHHKKNPTFARGRAVYWLSLVCITIALSFAPATADRSAASEPARLTANSSDPVIAAAGDIACDPATPTFNGGAGNPTNCRQKYTSDLLVNGGLSAVLDLGDNQYFCGGYQAFLDAYDPTWGRVKAITHPAVGNHEYLTWGGTGCDTTNEGATGYFKYFGSAAGPADKGYYSFDIGTWHIIALNSSCPEIGGCGSDSPQYNWLKADLAANSNACTLAYWHVPLFSSGGRASAITQPFWKLLYDHNADLVLTGHDHIYERFAPQDPSGELDLTRGIREFVVGTGGANHTSITAIAPNSEVRNTDTFGVLKLTLHPSGYDWRFVHESIGSFTDSGSAPCHGAAAPTGLVATSVAPNQVALSWNAGSGGTAIVGYRVFRNGVQIANVNTVSYVDNDVRPQILYEYYVVAYDAAGMISPPSNTLKVTTPANPVPSPSPTPTPTAPSALFRDGFESGNLRKWTKARGMIVQRNVVAAGQFAARANGWNGPAVALEQVAAPQYDVVYRVRLNLLGRGANAVNVMQFRDTSGKPLLTVHISTAGRLGYRNNVTGQNINSGRIVPQSAWVTVQVHVQIAGEMSRVDVWYGSRLVNKLSRMQSLGTQPVGFVRLGESRRGLFYDIAFDGVVVNP